jgi:Protein of unknown function (DUF2934)
MSYQARVISGRPNMTAAAGTLEERIREHAYYIWEASGRPSGRDEEFWQRACAIVATDADEARATARRRQPGQARSSTAQRTRRTAGR